MKNIPRIFIDTKIATGDKIAIDKQTAHYLAHVMRTNSCLCFNNGVEFNATLDTDEKKLIIGAQTNHIDPSGDITLMFAPIKKTDELVNMATQMGVKALQPVITERTVAHHVNWGRMKKIATEAAEQSNRNSVPDILSPIPFAKIDLSKIAFADERAAYGHKTKEISERTTAVLIGPEGGFSDSEFAALDNAGAVGFSLGKTILRAEVAAVVAITKITK